METNDIYEAPKSNVETDGASEEQKSLSKLLSEQKTISGQFVALFGTIFFFALMLMVEGVAPMFIYLAPAFAVGAILKYYACFVTSTPRIISSIIVAVITLGFLLLTGALFMPLIISFLSFLICMSLNRRPLDIDQEKLLYAWRHGKVVL